MTGEPTIRLATREDIPTILALIHELAKFENATHEVKATESTLANTLSFAASPHKNHRANHPDHQSHAHQTDTKSSGYAKTFLISPPDQPDVVAGMALWFHNYSTWRSAPGIYLEDLFVREEYRKKGYATRLIRELAREVRRIGGGRLEWACLDWNESALNFYQGLGANKMSEWIGLRVDGEALEKLAEREVKVE